MKKTRTLLLAIALLLCGCTHRTTQPIDQSNVSEQIQDQEYLQMDDLFDEVFALSELANKTEMELLASDSYAVFYNDENFADIMDTPLVTYIRRKDTPIPMAYDKRTGIFSSACRDPLCDHENCLWRNCGRLIYRGASGLFFLYRGEDENIIYSTDFYGNNAKQLYRETEHELSYLVEEDGYLYALAEGYEEEYDQIYTQILRIDLQNGACDVLIKKQGLYHFMPYLGNIIYFDGEKIALLDTLTSESTPYENASFLPIAVYNGELYYAMDDKLYKKDQNGNDILLDADPKSFELIFSRGEIRYIDIDGNVYQMDLDFKNVKLLYRAESASRVDRICSDGALLIYTYSEGKGASKKQYTVVCNLQNETSLQVRE